MKGSITTGMLLAFLVSGANAQPMIQKGANELAVHVSPDFEGAVGDMIFAQGAYGWFVRDRVDLRGMVSYTILEDVAGEDSDYRTSELGVAAEYHLGNGRTLVPYVGVGLGWRSTHFGKLEESALVYGARAGLELFIVEHAALDLEVTYKLGAGDVFINDFEAEDSDLSTAIGFRVFF